MCKRPIASNLKLYHHFKFVHGLVKDLIDMHVARAPAEERLKTNLL